MSGVNKAIIMGRLGHHPELTYTQSGTAVCKFSIATSRKQKDGNEITQWHRCVAWQKAAELINQYVKKGDQLYVEGEINYGQYEKDGITRYTTDIVVREFSFIGGGNQSQGQGHQNQQQNRGGYQGQQQGYKPPPQQQNQGQPQGNPQQRYQNAPMGQPQSRYQQEPPIDDIPF